MTAVHYAPAGASETACSRYVCNSVTLQLTTVLAGATCRSC